ncbi:dioxygenase [Streptomyces agglomeratus]|uniref:VOC family protein n=1 Tax=Streptomyces agglomeratus TaxID=285458 RepID=UPI000854AD58|nr:VOC family protein [Streptomyces agglomeratus]OEJ38542.1 dioxygenase [Streptomyces agglomeratus]OEJ47074.1 dioxygenase [Streptomyces agglomeratus]
MKETHLDHVVLWVNDPLASVEFYEKTVGVTGERVAEFAEGKVPFPSVRVSARSLFDLAPLTMAGSMNAIPGAEGTAGHPVNHVCLAMDRAAFEALHGRLRESGVPVSPYSHNSFGARGAAPRSFYFRDPDGNIIEARHYDE